MNGSLLPFSHGRAARTDARAQKSRILTACAQRQTPNSIIETSTRPSVFLQVMAGDTLPLLVSVRTIRAQRAEF